MTRIAWEALAEAAETEEERAKHEAELKKRAGKTSERLSRYAGFLSETVLTRSVDNFLSYVSELLAAAFRTRPEILRSNEEVRVDFVLDHRTMDELIEALADRRVERLAYKGLRDLAHYLSDRLGFDLFPEVDEFDAAIFTVECRNLLVHNRGVVNPTFLSRVPDPELFALGERLKLDVETIWGGIRIFDIAVAQADTWAARNWDVPCVVAHDDVPTYVPGYSG